MQPVTLSDHPPFRRPVLLAAFTGWNDAARSATLAVTALARHLEAQPFGFVEPDDFLDLQAHRPALAGVGPERAIRWSAGDLRHGSVDGRTVILLDGPEPSFRWRAYARAVTEVAASLEVEGIALLGSMLADVPHTVPTPVMGTTYDERPYDPGLVRTSYEGPVGIVVALQLAARDAGVPAAAFWAPTPNYAPDAPNPAAAAALLDRAGTALGLPLDVPSLRAEAIAWRADLGRLVAENDVLRRQVRRMETIHLDTIAGPPTSIAQELDRLLRQHRREEGA